MKQKNKSPERHRKLYAIWHGIFLIAIPSITLAAGFNCEKALTPVEKMICADDSLSTLDRSLTALYGSVRKNSPDLVHEQKIWLREKRNTCLTTACLNTAYQERIGALKKIDTCPANETSLLGSWARTKGEWAFEKMQFSARGNEREFTSWLHNHLEMIGTWKIDKCAINVRHNTDDALQFHLEIKKLDNGKLYLLDTDSQSELIYKLIQ